MVCGNLADIQEGVLAPTSYQARRLDMILAFASLTSRQRRSTAGSWPRTHRTHPLGAAAQTGYR